MQNYRVFDMNSNRLWEHLSRAHSRSHIRWEKEQRSHAYWALTQSNLWHESSWSIPSCRMLTYMKNRLKKTEQHNDCWDTETEHCSRVKWWKTKSCALLDTYVALSDTPNRGLSFSLISTATETQRKVPLLGFPVWFVLKVWASFCLKNKHSIPAL